MTAEQLRKSILQWAIEGKLTKQNPDESASELLDKINLEKEKLIKEKKIKKSDLQDSIIYKDNSDNCYYEKFKDGRVEKIEVPFEIPDNWRWVYFNEVVRFKIGKTPPTKDSSLWNGEIPWVSISDMNANVDLKTTKKYISRKALNSYFNNSLTEKETLIMSFKLTVGKTSILGIDAVHNEGIISIYPYYDKNYVFRDFLMLVLPIITKFGNKKGAIKGDTLNSKSLSNLFIPIPPLTEQQKIVNIIKYLNLKIDNYSNLEKELINIEKELHIKLEKSIINYAMQGKLVKQDEKDNSVDKLIDEIYKEKEKLVKVGKVKNTELKDLIIYKNSDDNSYYEKSAKILANVDVPFEIPDNWRWVKLNNISKIKGGYAFKSNKFSTNGVRIIRISDFNENSIVNTSIKRYPFSNELSSYKINENDILIAMTGGTVGKSILIKRLEEDMYLNQRVCMISPIIVKPYFLHISLRSSYIQDFINRIKTSTNDNISLENIKNFLIPIPPLEEQLRIVENITKIKNLLKTL